jgi:hypothetical protein
VYKITDTEGNDVTKAYARPEMALSEWLRDHTMTVLFRYEMWVGINEHDWLTEGIPLDEWVHEEAEFSTNCKNHKIKI